VVGWAGVRSWFRGRSSIDECGCGGGGVLLGRVASSPDPLLLLLLLMLRYAASDLVAATALSHAAAIAGRKAERGAHDGSRAGIELNE